MRIPLHPAVKFFLRFCLIISIPAIFFLEIVLTMIGAPHVSQD